MDLKVRPNPYAPNEKRRMCDCGAPATTEYYGLRFCEDCISFMEEQRGPLCSTCGDRGYLPVGDAGNSELTTTCPDCGPDLS